MSLERFEALRVSVASSALFAPGPLVAGIVAQRPHRVVKIHGLAVSRQRLGPDVQALPGVALHEALASCGPGSGLGPDDHPEGDLNTTWPSMTCTVKPRSCTKR
jgi:hypothetical protein